MDRKQQLLELATELIQTRGYSAFSYQDLSDRLGITKASIHYHFPTKEALGEAAVKRYRENVAEVLADARRASDDPWRQLQAYFDMISRTVNCKDRICACCSVLAEFNVVPAGMRDEMCAMTDESIDWLARVLADGRRQEVMHFSGSPASQAAVIFNCMQGAMQYGRSMGIERFRTVLRQIKVNLKAA